MASWEAGRAPLTRPCLRPNAIHNFDANKSGIIHTKYTDDPPTSRTSPKEPPVWSLSTSEGHYTRHNAPLAWKKHPCGGFTLFVLRPRAGTEERPLIGGETRGVYICAECVTGCQAALDGTRRSPADAQYQRERRLRHTIVSLQRHNALMQVAFDAIDEGVAIAGSDGEVLISNANAKRMFGTESGARAGVGPLLRPVSP